MLYLSIVELAQFPARGGGGLADLQARQPNNLCLYNNNNMQVLIKRIKHPMTSQCAAAYL